MSGFVLHKTQKTTFICKIMYLVNSKYTDPSFNIATEEYLLQHFKEDFFFIYVDSPSVICGKHQNPLAETNFQFITHNNIAIIRRLSGGGSVYHDFGNVNFCFIMNVESGKMVDFKKHTAPIIRVLESFGVNAELGVRNDILINGLKVSGNAEHVWKNRVLHHGTLLFNSDLKKLNESIKADPNVYTDKAVKSKRSLVTNIKPFIDSEISQHQFMERIEEIVSKEYNLKKLELTEKDIKKIQHLSESKYKTWEWNYGYSPKYNLKKEITIDDMKYNIDIFVENGVITYACFKCNNIEDRELSSKLKGCFHRIDSLEVIFPMPFDFLIKLFF